MAFTACFIVGLVTYFSLPVSLLPDIAIPQITIQVTGENSSARELENTVVTPVRRQLLQVAGLREIKSETRDGAGVIRLEFDFGVNTDLAFIEVNEKIDAAMNSLPKEVTRPKAIKASATDIPVLYVNMTLKNDGAYQETDEQQFLELCELEGYGGMICATWMDRPLSVAGRVLVQENGAIVSRLVALDRDLLMIPSVAIHMNREVNDKASFNKQVDMLPVLGGACEEGALKKLIAEELQVSEEQILGSDLFLYVREKATVWGCNEEFISCGRLDDQQCVYGILKGLLTAKNARSIGVAAFFDNEEVGSGTKQGAASTFRYDVLHRIAQSLGGNDEDFHRAVASSFMVSADNAHAVHPNHPEHTDVNNCTYMNKGVVIKTHAGQKYTSDGMSVAAARELAARAGVPLQYFANRSDKVGGSTLGNLAMAQVSMNCVDIGLPQLAMHSCYETAGAEDTLSLIKLMQELYSSHFEETAFGTLSISK